MMTRTLGKKESSQREKPTIPLCEKEIRRRGGKWPDRVPMRLRGRILAIESLKGGKPLGKNYIVLQDRSQKSNHHQRGDKLQPEKKDYGSAL